MNTCKLFAIIGVMVLLADGCKKEIDPTTVNNNIEFSNSPDPVKRVSGTYDAVLIDVGFKSGNGFIPHQEGNFGLSKPDGSIKGGGYKLLIKQVGPQSVTVSVEGSSTSFVKMPKSEIGTYNVFTVRNGSNTEYQLRKSVTDPIALKITRNDAYNESMEFEYTIKFSYYYNKNTGDFHWGELEEVEPAPTTWFYLNGDAYTVYYKMLRKVRG